MVSTFISTGIIFILGLHSQRNIKSRLESINSILGKMIEDANKSNDKIRKRSEEYRKLIAESESRLNKTK